MPAGTFLHDCLIHSDSKADLNTTNVAECVLGKLKIVSKSLNRWLVLKILQGWQ